MNNHIDNSIASSNINYNSLTATNNDNSSEFFKKIENIFHGIENTLNQIKKIADKINNVISSVSSNFGSSDTEFGEIISKLGNYSNQIDNVIGFIIKIGDDIEKEFNQSQKDISYSH